MSDTGKVGFCCLRRILENLEAFSKAQHEVEFEGRLLTCSPTQTPAHGSAACGTLCTARSIIPLTDRTKPATSPTPFVILDTLDIFAWPSSTSLIICICRLVGLWSSAEMLMSGVTPGLAPRTISNVFTYELTSSALSVSRLSYAAFHSLSDTERTGVGCSVDSVGGGLGTDSAGRRRGSACDAAGGW